MADSSKAFEIQKRRGLIVWVYSLKQLKNLRRYGFVHYVSNKMKYVVLYINEENIQKTIDKLHRLHFVRDVDISYRPDIDMSFGEKVGTEAAFPVSENNEEKTTE
ncbi:YlbG family protein [Tetragenococcus halophilus]|uniref:YlbG family protein n=1 Tax=Tetragenococcus halophilus TaxID=51669 RepID=UPI001F48BAE4|nr:YlbG family protein [Tetragenococcus halophilus]MCF1684915.1 YlbG family protein [Tetragenococcus halophilus]